MADLSEELKAEHFRVAIFGSARMEHDSEIYQMVFDLARLVASSGLDLVTGGGPGLMSAASKGYYKGKRSQGRKKAETLHSIGLNITLPDKQDESSHLDLKQEFDRFSERLDHFILLSNAFVIAPGGVGTLLEFFYTWQLAQVRQITDTPIILLGEMWYALIRWLHKWPTRYAMIGTEELELLYVTKTCEDALTIIMDSYHHYQEGGRDFCKHYHNYRIS